MGGTSGSDGIGGSGGSGNQVEEWEEQVVKEVVSGGIGEQVVSMGKEW